MASGGIIPHKYNIDDKEIGSCAKMRDCRFFFRPGSGEAGMQMPQPLFPPLALESLNS
jgi:hypothetical protein